MPASEETYRRQPTLHVVFAISSIAMLLSIVWMIMADHLRPWKQVQREFQHVEHDKLEATKQQKLQEQKETAQAKISEIDAQIKQADQTAAQRAAEIKKIDSELNSLGGKTEKLDTSRKFKKAELDSLRSLYDGMIERGEEREARHYLNSTVAKAEQELKDLSKELEVSETKKKAKEAEKERLLGYKDNLEDEKKKLTREVDRVNRLIEQKDAQYFGLLAWLRGLPGIDMAAPPTKIQQISLPELTINYNFKDVPRYDRCTTCHQGIDRLGYDKDAEGKPMSGVFAAHPFLSSGATSIDPKGKVVTAGLYLDPNGPHPINSFGCTICHGGQGSGTDFTYASHTPADLEQAEEWKRKYGWQEVHHWDYPMLPDRFIESSCVKCHHQVTDIPQAEEAAGRLPADRALWLHGLSHHRRRGLVRPRPDRRADGRPQLEPHRLQALQGLGGQVDQEPARVPARFPHAPVLRPHEQQRPGRPAQDPRRDPGDHPLPVHQEHSAGRLR